MAAGALGSVSNRLRHENGDTHVVICDDVFSDAGSTPAASTTHSASLRSPPSRWRRRSSVAQVQTPFGLSGTNSRRFTSNILPRPVATLGPRSVIFPPPPKCLHEFRCRSRAAELLRRVPPGLGAYSAVSSPSPG